MRPALLLLAFAIALTLPATAVANSYADQLADRAIANDLHEQPAWRAFLHYQPRGDGVLSEVDSRRFFLADNGASDAEAELRATIRAFFEPADTRIGPRDEHPQCRFIARYRWLDKQLAFDDQRLPEQSCTQFEEWRDQINPHSMALVFPAAYLNNPSSMFGHTLLRIDPPAAQEKGELNSYAVNFAAQTDETNGVLFAVKGLTGLYPGRYSLRKYYEMVNDYVEVENRSMWSYPLDFEPREIERMLRHLWEMEEVSFRYYFFSENCSYQLLRLLEAGRPGLDIASGFFYPVEPTATVKRLVENGLTTEPEFRPSLIQRVRGRFARLPQPGQQYVMDLVAGRTAEPPAELSTREQATALETAFDLLKYRQADGVIDADTYGERSLPILRRRSDLPAGRGPDIEPPDTAPHRGHDATRISAGIGNNDTGSFVEFGFRTSFHGLTERSPGFTPGAQLEAFSGRIRVPTDGSDPELAELNIADIMSLAPRGPLIQPRSWRFRGGYREVWLDDDNSEGSIEFVGGIGPAWGLTNELTAYAFAQAQALVDSDLPQGASAGVGARLGLLWSPHAEWATHAWFEGHEHPSRLDRVLVEGVVEQTWAPTRDWALNLRLAGHGQAGDTSAEGILNVQYYY